MLRASGSKVITDPVQLGPDLLQFSLDGGALGHEWIVASAFPDVLEAEGAKATLGNQLPLSRLVKDVACFAKEKRLPRERAADEPLVQLREHRFRGV
jgi:hypothetical protein